MTVPQDKPSAGYLASIGVRLVSAVLAAEGLGLAAPATISGKRKPP
jgi:hypothetical protein